MGMQRLDSRVASSTSHRRMSELTEWGGRWKNRRVGLEDQPVERDIVAIECRLDSAALESIHDPIGELGIGTRIGDEYPLCLFAARELLHVPFPHLDGAICTIALAAIFSASCPRRHTLPAGAHERSVRW